MNLPSPAGYGKRTLLPAPTADDEVQARNEEATTPGQPSKTLPKRMQITAVACQPCQQRKSKVGCDTLQQAARRDETDVSAVQCDGIRPICSSCVAKRRTDCAYDAAGDQRRTAALKQRIRALEKQAVDLKAIISGICLSTDKDAAILVALQLQADQFRSLDQAASTLRIQGFEDGSVDQSYRLDAGLSSANQGDQTYALPPLYTWNIDPALAQDLSFPLEQSSSWASSMPPRRAGPGSVWPGMIPSGSMVNASRMAAPLSPANLRGASQWAGMESPVEASDSDWQSIARSSAYPRSLFDQGQAPDPVHRKGSFQLSSPAHSPALTHSVREEPLTTALGDDTRQSRYRRYWYKAPRHAMHINMCASAAGLSVNTREDNIQLDDTPVPVHALQPNNEPDDRVESRIYTDFIHIKRRLVEQGWPIDDALGNSIVNPEAFLDRSNSRETGNPQKSICDWASDAVHLIEGMQTPEKLATMIVIVRLMRWRIIPTLEHYENVPECMRPTPVQILVPHPAWIDFLPWPEVRDVFITNPEIITAGDPLKVLSACTSVNWPWSTAEAIYAPHLGTKDVCISPQFERYIEDINNWSLSPDCLAIFPDLADKAWIRGVDGEDEEIGRPDEK
ncbi:hypothetical protein W97_00708 [Coniosporium apollinis CBS 100218]|uniref:Zn(2)-C6 fungal-type domain-containing protein n=1 Tax=Coniosporium apollinis (strain CBS 100218) TaxID=1168221 RepID=R7YHY2_CONA1|nr:uncharacterized protein W97_00708 [Coniosporium apollinis CBS 100218]EON61493.1 hypothetical protein W97_00708 [Coniosporium apollinis CBS 100218]